MDDAGRKALWAAITNDVYRDALARTVRIARRRGVPEDQLAAYAEEFLDQAIFKTADGDRNWDPTAVPEIAHFLAQAARSLMDADCRNGDTALTEPLENVADPSRSHGSRIASQSARPDQLLLAESIINEAMEAVAGDRDLEPILLDLIDGKTSAEIAASSKVDVREIYTKTRKLRRRLDQLGLRPGKGSS